MQALKYKKWLWLVLYGFFLAASLLYCLFPSEAFRNHFQTMVCRAAPQVLVSIGKISPSFPFGIKLTGLRISLKSIPDVSLFEADKVMIRPGIWSFLRGKLRYYFNCFAYGGNLKGWFHFQNDNLNDHFSTAVRLKDIRIQDCAPVSARAGRNITGVVGGDVTYSGEYKSLAEGSGSAKLGLSEGRVELLRPVLCLEAIDFNDLTVDMTLEKRKIHLKDVSIMSRDIKGRLSGIVKLKEQISRSNLELKGIIEPLPALFKGNEGALDCRSFLGGLLQKRKIPFVINGTLERPGFRLE